MANLTRYNPFNEAVSLREAMDRLFADSFIAPQALNTRGMSANLFETQDGFTFQMPVPGVKPEDIDITTQQDTVTIKWETKVEVPENATTHWHGFQSSQFQQTFTLPSPINSDRVEATINNGVLTLSLPKAESAKARSIKVSAK